MDRDEAEACSSQGASNVKAIEKKMRRYLATGEKIIKSCGSQLREMNNQGLLDKNGMKVLKRVERCQEVDIESRTVITFIGESGAGKSTLLNALLDRENLAATSGLRACTSVATEFSSRTADMKSNFYAIIEYIDRQELETEMEILCEDVLGFTVTRSSNPEGGPDELSSSDEDDDEKDDYRRKGPRFRSSKRRRIDDSTSDSIERIAKAKLQALLPDFRGSDFNELKLAIADLYAKNEFLRAGRQLIEMDDEDEFVEEVHSIIANRADYDSEARSQLWPLIKVVKIYLDAEVLRTGAVLVDLPGLHDQNPAREAVSQKYLADANEIIVVAGIKRVLTSDTAAALAEMGYIKQLQYDGTKRITLVCTSCDLFEPDDARKDLRQCDDFAKTYDKMVNKLKLLKKENIKLSSSRERAQNQEEYQRLSKSLQIFCAEARDKYVPAMIENTYSRLLANGSQHKVSVTTFLVSSTDYQKKMNRLFADMESTDTITLSQTQIPLLREYIVAMPIKQKISRTEFFIHKVARAFTSMNFLVQDTSATMTQNMREVLSASLKKDVAMMTTYLEKVEDDCQKTIKLAIDSLTSRVEKVASKSVKASLETQETFRDEFRWATYRGVCRRQGEWPSEPKKSLNKKFIENMEQGFSKDWIITMEKIDSVLKEYTRTISHEINQFQNRWLANVGEHCPSKNSLTKTKMIEDTFLNMRMGTTKLYAKQTKSLEEQSKKINRRFRSTGPIRRALTETYGKASLVTGPGSYDNMVEIVSQGLKTVNPFQSVAEFIRNELEDLKSTLDAGNQKWREKAIDEIVTNTNNWLALSEKTGKVELEKKAKLRATLELFEDSMDELVEGMMKMDITG